jgi:4-aminobutyrate aminotransferase-like enzyme
MIGMDVVDAAGDADPARLDAILEQLKDRGVLAGKTGADRHVLTFLPPLTISPDESGELIDALEQVVL